MRYSQLQKILTNRHILVGNRYPVLGMSFDYDGEMVKLVFRAGGNFIQDTAHGAYFPVGWFDFYVGIPF